MPRPRGGGCRYGSDSGPHHRDGRPRYRQAHRLLLRMTCDAMSPCCGREVEEGSFGQTARGKVPRVSRGQARFSIEGGRKLSDLDLNVTEPREGSAGGGLQGEVILVNPHSHTHLRRHWHLLPVTILPKYGILHMLFEHLVRLFLPNLLPHHFLHISGALFLHPHGLPPHGLDLRNPFLQRPIVPAVQYFEMTIDYVK